MAAGPVFLALFVGNMAVYFAVFLSLLDVISSLMVVEIIIVAVDGTLIKLISRYATFQTETFTELKWKYAFIIAGIGNILSYYVGTVMN